MGSEGDVEKKGWLFEVNGILMARGKWLEKIFQVGVKDFSIFLLSLALSSRR